MDWIPISSNKVERKYAKPLIAGNFPKSGEKTAKLPAGSTC